MHYDFIEEAQNAADEKHLNECGMLSEVKSFAKIQDNLDKLKKRK